MAKSTLKTFGGGHLGDDPKEEIQTDVEALLPTGVTAEKAEEVTTNEDEQENVLPVPGTVERR